MSEPLRPTLCIVAGPNGSGKTTTSRQLLSHQWAQDSLYINPDDIAQNKYGDWNSLEAMHLAAKEATRLRYEYLSERRNFVFETVFSSNEKLDFVRRAKEEGFFIRMFFVCTDSPEINVRRITKRYLEGGHEVPISKVISRYYKSLANLSRVVSVLDRLYIYDNSIEDLSPRLLLRMTDGHINKLYVTDMPAWARFLIE